MLFILTYYVCMNFGIRLLELSSADQGCLIFGMMFRLFELCLFDVMLFIFFARTNLILSRMVTFYYLMLCCLFDVRLFIHNMQKKKKKKCD